VTSTPWSAASSAASDSSRSRRRTTNSPNTYAAIRNLVIGAFRRAGYATIALTRRYHHRGERFILALVSRAARNNH
jgi:hypothetical protein